MLTEFWEFLNEKHTILGKMFWIINCFLILFFVYFLLYILLSPFHFLSQFISAFVIIIQFSIAVVVHHLKLEVKLFEVLDNMPVLYHVALFVALIFAYYFSVNHIWKNKKDYLT